MTWALVGIFVGLTVVLAPLLRRDARRAVERRRRREANRAFTDAMRRGIVHISTIRESFVGIGRAAERMPDALDALALAIKTSPYKPTNKQKGEA